MRLVDIEDFSLRSKVAQLMAVAPALPIVDLYHLIVDSEGDLPLARKQAIRMSEAPPAQHRPGLDVEGDEVMIKIDPSDPAFESDNDEPEPLTTVTTASRPSKRKPKPNGKATNSKGLRNPARSRKGVKSGTECRSNTSAKRMQSSSMNPTHARETSSDRDFVVPDNVFHSHFDSDVSNDSYQTTGTDPRIMPVESDIRMLEDDDELDLDIDMQPRFAYNARLLED
jgi:hypothetical protein